MKIIVKSRLQAFRDSYDNCNVKTAIISINTPGCPENTFCASENLVRVLPLFFHDIGVRDRTGVPMGEGDAVKIAEFVEWCKDNEVEELWVHCDAGISRSSGVAAAILQYLTGDDSAIFDSPRYYPNMVCYRLTLNALLNGAKKGKNK